PSPAPGPPHFRTKLTPAATALAHTSAASTVVRNKARLRPPACCATAIFSLSSKNLVFTKIISLVFAFRVIEMRLWSMPGEASFLPHPVTCHSLAAALTPPQIFFRGKPAAVSVMRTHFDHGR